MRLYSVAVVSLTVGAPLKWTDNLLAHHAIPGIRARSRGVSRGVPWAGLVQIALVRELHLAIGCGVREAVGLSDALLTDPSGGSTPGRWTRLEVDRGALEQDLQRRLAEVLESAPRPRRGRPPRRSAEDRTLEGHKNDAGRR